MVGNNRIGGLGKAVDIDAEIFVGIFGLEFLKRGTNRVAAVERIGIVFEGRIFVAGILPEKVAGGTGLEKLFNTLDKVGIGGTAGFLGEKRNTREKKKE